MCLYPKLIKNRKYLPNKKNGGLVPPVLDKRVLLVPVGCGKCIECMKKKSNQWKVRLQEEIKTNKGIMVTLTFSNESLKKLYKETKLNGYNRDNEICKIAVRRFLERHRKEHKKSIRHFLMTEIGGGRYEHIHIHGLLFNTTKEIIEKHWKYGFIHFGDYVNEKTINYIVKYISKVDEKHKYYTPIVLASKGIGSNYLNSFNATQNKILKKDKYKLNDGKEIGLPIYYRNKLFDDDTKEKKWLELLDKNERYVLGKKINIKYNENEYYSLLEIARNINKELGFGDDIKNWDLKIYENQRRNILYKERLFEKKDNNNKNKNKIEPVDDLKNDIKPNFNIDDAF